MTGFSYSAVTPGGKTRHGTIEADSLADARQKLRLRGLLPVKIRAGAKRRLFQRAPRLSETARALLTRQLATLVTGGVRIEDALKTVAQQNALADLSELCLSLRALAACPQAGQVLVRSWLQRGQAHKGIKLQRVWTVSFEVPLFEVGR